MVNTKYYALYAQYQLSRIHNCVFSILKSVFILLKHSSKTQTTRKSFATRNFKEYTSRTVCVVALLGLMQVKYERGTTDLNTETETNVREIKRLWSVISKAIGDLPLSSRIVTLWFQLICFTWKIEKWRYICGCGNIRLNIIAVHDTTGCISSNFECRKHYLWTSIWGLVGKRQH